MFLFEGGLASFIREKHSFFLKKAVSSLALRHAKDQARTGQIGHQGSDGSSFVDRIKGAGYKGSGMGENIQYGCFNAIDIVANLMIDDDVPDRGHSKESFRRV